MDSLKEERMHRAQIGVFIIKNRSELTEFFYEEWSPVDHDYCHCTNLPAWDIVKPHFEKVLNDMKEGRETDDYSYHPGEVVKIHIHRNGINFDCWGRWQ